MSFVGDRELLKAGESIGSVSDQYVDLLHCDLNVDDVKTVNRYERYRFVNYLNGSVLMFVVGLLLGLVLSSLNL